MKMSLPVSLLLLALSAPLAGAAFYQWTDAQGVVHFTDSAKNIPKKYRAKAKKVQLSEEPSAVKVNGAPAPANQAPQPSPQAAAQPPATPGGHPEQWWRDRFTTLRNDTKFLQDRLATSQSKLAEARRKRVIYQRVRDREAVNAVQDDVAADEKKLAQVSQELAELENEADRAGVPVEWRR